jgi:hypothetical protein
MTQRRPLLSAGLALLLASASLACSACGAPSPEPAADAGLVAAATQRAASAQPRATPTAVAETRPHMSAAAWRALVQRLSEPNGEFFSDNFISNETSYLQIADALSKHSRPGGVYLGVGPEQNFSYIALSRPQWAYLLDIRRDNMVLHLMYKALFDLAQDRAHFLAMLTGRDVRPPATDAGASLEQVMRATETVTVDDRSFAAIHRRLRSRIERNYGFALDDADTRSLERAHHAFRSDGLDIRFKLKDGGVRRYPSLRELLSARAPGGRQSGFMASEEAFRFVQEMQREHRLVPLVGDFAGDRTMPGLAQHLRSQKQVVSAFYVSNVEQYLMRDGLWWKWQRNVAALPTDQDSVFIRAYLDQGHAHPKQLAGHRTATTLHPMQAFVARRKPYRSMHALASDQLLAP